MENVETSHASDLLVSEVSEESVDIYDGLDTVFNRSAEEPCFVGSQLKESMDLYEEIVTEEQQNRESSYAELKSGFRTAQNHIKELHSRLERLELQNTGLIKENYSLKKNISALLQTARKEVIRKDAEIQRLSQRSDRGHHYYPSVIKNVWDPNFSSHSSTSRLVSSQSCPTSSPPQRPSSNFPPLPKSLPNNDQPPRDACQSMRKDSHSLPRASKSSCHSHSKRDSEVTDKQTESDKHKSSHREHRHLSEKSESIHRRHSSVSDANNGSHHDEKNRFHRADKDTVQKSDSKSCKRKSYSHDGHHRSDEFKSSPTILETTASSDEKKDGRRQDKAKTAPSGPKHSTSLSSKESYSQKIKITSSSSRSYNSKDWKRSCVDQHGIRYRDSSKEREGARQRDHQWKGERLFKDDVRKNHIVNSQSQTSRKCEKLRTKESSKGDKDRCEKTHKVFKTSPEEANTSKKNSEESSPNRKLCFMETLNLTLSPIKKPVLSFVGSLKDPIPVDKNAENGSDEENLVPNMEDMCVIDDIENIEFEGELRDITERSLNNHKVLSSERTLEAAEVEGIQEKDTVCKQTAVADILVQTTSTHSHPLDITVKQVNAHLAAKSPETGYAKATNVPKINEENIKLVSDSKGAECGMAWATDAINAVEKSERVSKRIASYDLQKAYCENDVDSCAEITKSTAVNSSVKHLETAVQQNICLDSRAEDGDSSLPKKTDICEAVTDKGNPVCQTPPASNSQVCQQGSPASSSSIHLKDNCEKPAIRKDTDTVSSTINLESLPQEGLSLKEAIYVLTQTNEDTRDSSTNAIEPSSSTSCIGVSKVSSTTEEKTLLKSYSEMSATPSKSFSPRNGQENHMKPSSSVLLLHDEDSMMHTLSNLKRIPDAISPLRSPVRVIKRCLLHVHSKPGHVKSLQKDFSTTAVDANLEKLDVNKENKYPGSPAKRDALNLVDKVSDLNSSRSDTDLEEGEILSESDETAASSPTTATKRAKLAQPVRNKSSPKSVLKKKLAERRVASEESREVAGVTTQSPKSRFKTVCPAASKASFCTIEEIMETFKLVRAEIRKKYMKLHKTFPKKSFHGMMDNFQKSFLEFVEGAHFDKICDQPGELKSRLKKLIESVFGKVSNNGIVKRIFEQQAVDLKQKLWDFVNVQVDYLFVDIHTTLKSFCKASRTVPEDMRSSDGGKVSQQPPGRKPSCELNQAQPSSTSPNQAKSCAVVPYKKGLGSRGKDIRITHGTESHPLNSPNAEPVAEFILSKNPPATPEKNHIPSLVLTQNGSLLDRTDFELLTEQQASSLTFNLVRDSQMGEIFKCLLQGSDLLESSGIAGENTAWSLSTPRKDGERNISIITPSKFDYPSKLLSPAKFDTPSKLFATWSSISPRKMSSPCSKDQTTLNPALLDENCLLEVPSQNKALLQAGLASHKSYSLLAEDLAVSLTIPSPLKSDSHLSFLQPSTHSMHVMSTPENVISAHICEDALLDGEDATEHDIHLALDTDNSSCGSSSSLASETPAMSFVFKPDVTMQALVMEKSNDHFIVKIRQANPGADSTLTADESLSETLTEEQHIEDNIAAQDSETAVTEKLQKAVSSPSSFPNVAESSVMCPAGTESSVCLTAVKDLTLLNNQPDDMLTQHSTFKETLKNLSDGSPSNKSLNNISENTVIVNESGRKTHFREENLTQSPSKMVLDKSQNKIIPSKCAVQDNCQTTESSYTNQRSQELSSHVSNLENNDVDVSETERSLVIAEDMSSSPDKGQRDSDKGRKRKKYQDKSKAKRFRKEKSTEEVVFPSKEVDEDSKSSTTCLSPGSLSAKNVIRKKGEVVMAWTRDEDRAILMDMKTKGASRETFSALSEKLNKPSGQIAHRFYQLMKLFKKMDT